MKLGEKSPYEAIVFTELMRIGKKCGLLLMANI